MKKIIVALFGVVLLSGCATPYKPNGFAFNGGFDSVELEPNYFRVVFKGNEKTSRERANDFALLRVSDLMLERNCSSFAVVKSSNDIKKKHSCIAYHPNNQHNRHKLRKHYFRSNQYHSFKYRVYWVFRVPSINN